MFNRGELHFFRVVKNEMILMFLYSHSLTHTYLTYTYHSYSFKAYILDNTGEIILTCFSDEANCIVKYCNELMKDLRNKDPYKPPKELTDLEGTTHLFQLNFAPESTKEKKKNVY